MGSTKGGHRGGPSCSGPTVTFNLGNFEDGLTEGLYEMNMMFLPVD